MIYITGDLHGNIDKSKLNTKNFPQQKEMTKADYVIIAGDFGCIWSGRKDDEWLLDWLESKNFTTLWTDGNHENFNLINQYPVTEWNGGKIHQIRPSVIHLMRGQVFLLDGKKIFTFGGAASIDKEYRKENISWWPQEIPDIKEFNEGMKNLEKHNMTVDFVITHTAPNVIISQLALDDEKLNDPTNRMLDDFMNKVDFKRWYFGHFHTNRNIGKFTVLYNKIEVLQERVIIPKDPEPRDWKIEKYLSKYKAAYPNNEQLTYEEVGLLIDKWDGEGRHITYPLAGLAWDQVEWQKKYNRKKEFEKLAEKILNHQVYGSEEKFMVCASGKQCPKSNNCKCWKLHEYMIGNNIIGHTCTLFNPETCSNFRPYLERGDEK
jgi:hypothetical protein